MSDEQDLAEMTDAADFDRLLNGVRRLDIAPKDKDEPQACIWVTLHSGKSGYAEQWADESRGQAIVRALMQAQGK